MKVTAVFDIGKTNKKFFLFDKNYQEAFKEYQRFEEIEDDDGFPSDNLPAIRNWIKSLFDQVIKNKKYKVQTVNFFDLRRQFCPHRPARQSHYPALQLFKRLSRRIASGFLCQIR